MARRRCEQVREMYGKGMTYEQIAEFFGVTTQRVHQLQRADDAKDGFRANVASKVKYVGLRNWMFENRINLNELKNLSGLTGITKPLTGTCEPSKHTIDAILRVTGLTYEECFGVEDGGLK